MVTVARRYEKRKSLATNFSGTTGGRLTGHREVDAIDVAHVIPILVGGQIPLAKRGGRDTGTGAPGMRDDGEGVSRNDAGRPTKADRDIE